LFGNRSAGSRKLTQADRAMIEMPDRQRDKKNEPMIEVFPSDHYGLLAELRWQTPP